VQMQNPMSEQQHRRIDWSTSFRKFAAEAWAVGTYVGLLIAAAVMAVIIGNNHPGVVAFLAVANTTFLHWIVFLSIERRSNK